MNSPFTIHHSPFRCAQWIASATLVVSAHLHGAPPNYDDHIRPIFEQSCNNCHNPDKQKGDLDLSTYSAAMRGGSGGKFAEPGEGASSSLYGVITHTKEPKMPEKGGKIPKAEIDLIRSWIDGGMLENKTGKPKKKKKPAFQLKVAASTSKPDGPPAMPQHLLLEPVVTPLKSTVVTDMATSPWAPLLAIAGQRQVLLYHSDTLDLAAVLPFDQGQPEVLSFHPSGKYLLAGGGVAGKSGTTVTWEVETGKIILRVGKDYDSVLAASLRADLGGVSLGGPGKRVKLWDTGEDALVASIKKHTDWVTQLAYSPDGVLLASGGRGGGVYVWEADTGNEFHNLRAHKSSITGLAWRSDSNLLASTSEDGDVIVWSMSQGKQVKKWQAHAGGVLDIDWTRSGQLVTSGRDKKVKIWKADFGLAKELPAFPSMVVDVAFSHDGKRLFCADWAGAITAWDVADLTKIKQIGTLQANPPTVARQIELVREKMASFPTQLKQADQALSKAKSEVAANKTKLEKKEAEHKKSIAHQKKLTVERGQLDSRLKKFNSEGEQLKHERHKKQIALTQAREKLKQHNAVMATQRKTIQQLNGEAQKLMVKEQQSAKKEQLARKQSEANPEDAALKQAAAQAKKDLDQDQHQLAEKREDLEQQKTTLAKLTNQQKGPGNQLAAAAKVWEDVDAQWKAHHAQRKATQDQRNGINKPLAETTKHLSKLDTEIKASRATHTKSEQTLKSTQSHRDNLNQQTTIQQTRLTRWQAAAINTDVLRLNKESLALQRQQDKIMDAFTRLAAEIGKLKDPADLTKKSHELNKLRNSIDQAAPQLRLKKAARKKRQAEYEKELKR